MMAGILNESQEDVILKDVMENLSIIPTPTTPMEMFKFYKGWEFVVNSSAIEYIMSDFEIEEFLEWLENKSSVNTNIRKWTIDGLNDSIMSVKNIISSAVSKYLYHCYRYHPNTRDNTVLCILMEYLYSNPHEVESSYESALVNLTTDEMEGIREFMKLNGASLEFEWKESKVAYK